MTPFFEVTIPGRVGIKKNSKRLIRVRGRVIPVSSKKSLSWEKVAMLHILSEKNRIGLETVTGLIRMEAHFHFKNHQWEPDLSNCYEGLSDCLEKCRVIANDKQINSHDGSCKIFANDEKTVVKLYILDK